MASYHKMGLLEEYQELIERDSEDISVLWKVVQTFLYLCSAVSGYVCAIMFYIIWQIQGFLYAPGKIPAKRALPIEICGGRCIFWAEVELAHPINYPLKDHLHELTEQPELRLDEAKLFDWRQDVILVLDNTFYCDIYHKLSFCSCIFGVTGLTLFTICGRGGYGSRIFTSPWRIVVPGFFLNLIFMGATMFLTHYIEHGFFTFTSNLFNIANENGTTSRCNVIQYYLEPFNKHQYDVCHFYFILQVSSWIMSWSWTAGFIVLVARIINVTDFRLLRVKVYKAPLNIVPKDVTKGVREVHVEQLHPVKRKKLSLLLCCSANNKNE